jgi:hypothetical protein
MARNAPGRVVPLYAVAMQQAQGGDNLDEMKALAEQAEAHVASEGDIPAALDALKETIAKMEAGREG